MTISQTFPRSVLSVSRQEFGHLEDNPQAQGSPLRLHIKSGALPTDLQGHVYIVGPVGSVASLDAYGQPDQPVVVPTLDGTTLLYNGDGMVYRLDFDRVSEGVLLHTRITKPPSYYADAATHVLPQYQGTPTPNHPNFQQDLRFRNFGITRLSGKLGIRNQLNTAFLPMQFAGEDRQRLLVTWDVGRPYEIDPQTLATVTPMGWDKEWKPVSQLVTPPFAPPPPFKTLQTCAHPGFDPYQQKGQVFNINSGRSLENLISQLLPVGWWIREGWQWLKNQVGRSTPRDTNLLTATAEVGQPQQVFLVQPPPPPKRSLGASLWASIQMLLQFCRAIWEFFRGNFVDLVVWDGQGELQKWSVRYRGRPIKIQQSTHQIAVTQDYVVIIDTAFKVSTEELLPPLKGRGFNRMEKFARNVLDHPQLANNHIYIVDRRHLTAENSQVEAQRVILPLESAHFLADYQNPEDVLTLHFSHVCAWDAGETISKFDYESPQDAVKDELRPLYGVLYGPTDISRLGYYRIQAQTGEVLERQVIQDQDWTWGPAIYTYRPGPSGAPPDQFRDLYWSCLGCWPEMLLPHITQLYSQYEYRAIAQSEIEAITKAGRPSNLLRLHIADAAEQAAGQPKIAIAETYGFPEGHYVMSPQFVPAQGRDGSTDGYIVCIVQYGAEQLPPIKETNGNEIWIFDAADLREPICKLWHPQLNVGFTVHSTWLEKAEKRTASYQVPVEADYAPIVDRNPEEVQDLFRNWVYPQREPHVGHVGK